MRVKRAVLLAFLSTFILGLGSAAWGFLIEPGWVRVNQVGIESHRWPAGWAPLKVAVLGDLHIGAPHIDLEALDEVVARVNAEQPDIVVLLGDYVIHGVLFGSFVEPEPIAPSLAALRARHGVFAVLGNHDWWYDGARIRLSLEDAEITVLDSEATTLDLPDGRLWIAGLADDSTRMPNPRRTLAAVPEDEPVLVLAHDPAVFFDVPARPVAILAGHMHGGQVYLPLLGALITPGRAPARFAYGHIREDGKDLYVTAGLGTSILPVRFNMPPEIAILTIATPSGASP